MAGDWIKVAHALPDKPEVIQMASRLSVDQDLVAGKLVRLWIWADQQTIDGKAPGVTSAFIDRLTNCPGFSAALVEVGWLVDRNGRLQLPKFDRHNGQTAKQRALTKDRMKRSRDDANVTESSPEKRREEEEKNNSNSPQGSKPLVPGEPAPAAVMSFPVVGDPPEWGLIPPKLAEYQQTFPDLDVLAEFRKALQWCRDNKTNRKTASGMPKFLGSWLARAQNDGGRRGPQPGKRKVATYDASFGNRPDGGS